MNAASIQVTLREWEHLRPEQNPLLRNLFLGPEFHGLARGLSEQRLLEIVELRQGMSLRAFSHVGRVRLGPLDVIVQPKIKQTSLLNLLRYAYGFRKLELFAESHQRIEQLGFEDLLVHQLNAEVRELLSRGLRRNYVRKEELLTSPRGRIDIQQIATAGGVVTAKLPCTHFSRIDDSLLNRVLLAGVQLAASITTDITLRRDSHRLALALEESVTTLSLNASILDRVAIGLNRMTATYDSAISLIRLLWESQGVSFAGTDSPIRISGFLFDMNRFFQALLARFLGDHLRPYQVKEEQGLTGMMKYATGFNPCNHRTSSPRPDFVILDGNQAVALLDAKYRDLWEFPIPREMLYQLAIYASVDSHRVATILYPSNDRTASESRIDVRHPVTRIGIAQIRLRPVSLGRMEELIASIRSSFAARERVQYAHWLAFGNENPNHP